MPLALWIALPVALGTPRPTAVADSPQASSSEFVQLELEASRPVVLVDEPFEIVLTITVPRLDPPNQNFDPFSAQPPPRLELPLLSALPSGLKGPELTELLQPLLAGGRERFGFSINDITTHRDVFGRAHTARFRLPRESMMVHDRPAWRYRLTIRLSADLEGTYELAPARLRAQYIDRVGPGGTPSVRDVFVSSPSVTVRVVPPPEEERPESFVGALGTSLRADARLDAQRCRQGDPLLLTLDLRGEVSLANMRPPALGELAGIAGVFRVYDEAVQSEPLPDGRRYRYTVRPLVAGTIEWPALPISYFDTRRREYRTVHTDPVPVRVDAVAQFSLADIVDTPPLLADGRRSIRVRSTLGLPAAITVAPLLPTETLPSPRALVLWLLPTPLLVLATVLAVRTHAWRMARRQRRRRRNAFRRARSALRNARDERALLTAMARFFEARYEVPAPTFTPADAIDALRRDGQPDACSSALRGALQPLYDRVYSPRPDPSATSTDSLRQDLIAWVAHFEDSLQEAP